MKRLFVVALFLNAALLAGRVVQEFGASSSALGGGGAGGGPSQNGDVNCDGGLDLSDAVGILQFLFNGGPEPCAFAGEPDLEQRVNAIERALADLRAGDLRKCSQDGRLSIGGLDSVASDLDIEITALLSEVHAVATAGSDVGVDTGVAFDFLDAVGGRISSIEPIAAVSARALHRPERIARETDAAVVALNSWIAAVNETMDGLNGGFPALTAVIALAQAQKRDVAAHQFLDAMTAKNLEKLQDVATGEEYLAAKKAVEALVEAWEEKLSSIGDDAQLANIDLQRMLQKQQQTLQTMSNVSKMLHETAMAVIRKIG